MICRKCPLMHFREETHAETVCHFIVLRQLLLSEIVKYKLPAVYMHLKFEDLQEGYRSTIFMIWISTQNMLHSDFVRQVLTQTSSANKIWTGTPIRREEKHFTLEPSLFKSSSMVLSKSKPKSRQAIQGTMARSLSKELSGAASRLHQISGIRRPIAHVISSEVD